MTLLIAGTLTALVPTDIVGFPELQSLNFYAKV